MTDGFAYPTASRHGPIRASANARTVEDENSPRRNAWPGERTASPRRATSCNQWQIAPCLRSRAVRCRRLDLPPGPDRVPSRGRPPLPADFTHHPLCVMRTDKPRVRDRYITHPPPALPTHQAATRQTTRRQGGPRRPRPPARRSDLAPTHPQPAAAVSDARCRTPTQIWASSWSSR
jgi:hypothetical protein